MTKLKKRLLDVVLSLAGLAAVIAVWALAVEFTSIGLLLPNPMEVLQRFIYTL